MMRRPASAPKRGAMRAAAQGVSAQLTVTVRTIPAPVGGWNALDSLALMKSTDAIRLVNWWPRTTDVVIRGGADDHTTGITGTVKTLSSYSPETAANNALYGITDAGIFDVTTAGAVGAAVKAVTSGWCQHVNYSVSGADYLVLVNGVDKLILHDGTNWTSVDNASTPSITGVTTSDLVNLSVFKRRLLFCANNKIGFYYLPINAVGGAAAYYDLGGLFGRGGYLMATGTWTIDAGAGVDDFAVFVTSEGEVAVYQGTDPGDATAWSLVGVYQIGRPIGRKCLHKLGGDLLIICDDGVYPISKALQSAELRRESAITRKIENAFREAATLYGTLTGWHMEFYSAQSALIVNIPTSETTSKQYVMNTITKAWCEFDSWNATEFSVLNGELYFGTSTKTAKAWTGRDDFGSDVLADAKTAFQYFGDTARLKKAQLFRPILAVDGPLSFLLDINVDFEDHPPTGVATYDTFQAGVWDSGLWDTALWGGSLEIIKDWKGAAVEEGKCLAALLRISNSTLEVQWMATEFQYTTGGVM